MSDFQQYLFSGRLGADPETRYTDGGKAVVNFSVAINVSKDKTEWRYCEAWGKIAELIKEYFNKGSKIIVASSYMKTDEWEDRDGQKQKRLKVVVEKFSFPGGGKKAEGSRPKAEGDVPF